ncbi:prolipoprotein diacylglyceryl transferase, partial [Vibrio campbellii]
LSLPMIIIGGLMMVWAYKRGHFSDQPNAKKSES